MQYRQTLVSVGTDDGARGQFHCGFNNAVFMSERQTGFNNFALAHFMRARHDTSRRLVLFCSVFPLHSLHTHCFAAQAQP